MPDSTKAGLRVLVCGGRDYRDRDAVYGALDELCPRMAWLMSGGAPGADTLAWDWGWSRSFSCERFMADWKKHGPAAGPIRNQRMLEEGRPTLVLAFPRANGFWGRGTMDMVHRALVAGVFVQAIGTDRPFWQVSDRFRARAAGIPVEGGENVG